MKQQGRVILSHINVATTTRNILGAVRSIIVALAFSTTIPIMFPLGKLESSYNNGSALGYSFYA